MPVSDPTLAELAGLLRRLADEMQFGGSLENDPMAFINKARAFAEAIEGKEPFAHVSHIAGLHKPSGVVCGSRTCTPLYAFPAPKEELE